MENVFELAATCNMSVSLDLASYNVVESNLEFLKLLVKKYRPIVFANEEEARAFSGFTDPRKALEEIALLTDTAIVKVGAKGSLIGHNSKNYSADAIAVNCLDTTGAGDLYAAGFLFGYIQNFEPERCGKIGSLLAGKVIEEAGAKISDNTWVMIQGALRNI
jgi:sugar/nucleoside kinase (ribokinase family)